MPRVSVVIPTYNYAHFLPDAIESVLRQTFRDYELIVVDDGSTDQTPQVAARYQGRIRYHRQENRGLSTARNVGCQLARGEYFAFLDADDVWFAQKLTRQVALLERHPEAGLVSSAMELMDRSGAPLSGIKPGSPPGETFVEIVRQGTAAPSSYVVRRRCFEEIHGFDKQLVAMEDLEFCLRIAARHQIVHIPEPLGRYRVHGMSLSQQPEKVYPAYVHIYTQLLRDRTAPSMNDVIRRRLAHWQYIWGKHQVVCGQLEAGRRCIGAAVRTWPWVGWSLDTQRRWWQRALNLMKPFGVVGALYLAPALIQAQLERRDVSRAVT